MIRKFSVLYVGQIDLDHVGRDGTPADQRRYPNERIAEAYRSMVDVARVMRVASTNDQSRNPGSRR